MISKPAFLQGILLTLEGSGVDEPTPLHPDLTYTVPPGGTTQPLYFRGGDGTDELVTVPELHLAARECLTGTVVVDPGLVEV